jgi:hypothetical protein
LDGFGIALVTICCATFSRVVVVVVGMFRQDFLNFEHFWIFGGDMMRSGGATFLFGGSWRPPVMGWNLGVPEVLEETRR